MLSICPILLSFHLLPRFNFAVTSFLPTMSHIVLPAIPSPLCPVRVLSNYSLIRPSGPGQLFLMASASPLEVKDVRRVLGRVASLLHLTNGSLTSHFFCIGAATTAAAIGISDETIMRMGCWSSLAFCKYIRFQVNQFK